MEMCDICWEPKYLYDLPCKHKFCPQCLSKHFGYDARCPTCRSIIYDSKPQLVSFSKTDTYSVEITKVPKHGIGLIIKLQDDKVCVTGIKRWSLASQKKIKKGDVLLSINGIPIKQIKCVHQILSLSDKRFVLFFTKPTSPLAITK